MMARSRGQVGLRVGRFVLIEVSCWEGHIQDYAASARSPKTGTHQRVPRRRPSRRHRRNLKIRSVSAAVPRTVHKAKASECGGARRGHRLSSDWSEVTCADCMARRPGLPPPRCGHCERFVLGVAAHLPRAQIWLHGDCVEPFKRTPRGRELFKPGANPFAGERCEHCGFPGGHFGGQPCPRRDR
jgi:hypothetical protein